MYLVDRHDGESVSRMNLQRENFSSPLQILRHPDEFQVLSGGIKLASWRKWNVRFEADARNWLKASAVARRRKLKCDGRNSRVCRRILERDKFNRVIFIPTSVPLPPSILVVKYRVKRPRRVSNTTIQTALFACASCASISAYFSINFALLQFTFQVSDKGRSISAVKIKYFEIFKQLRAFIANMKVFLSIAPLSFFLCPERSRFFSNNFLIFKNYGF